VAEIDPNAVAVSSLGNAFIYDLLPTIGGSDSGVDEVVITAPAGYTNLTVTSVSVGGAGQASNCPTPGAGEYCTAIAGQVMTVTLGTKVGVSLTNIQIGFAADAPGTPGSTNFSATVDDTATGAMAPQATVAGNADGDAGDANSITVAVEGNAVTSVVAEIDPNAVPVSSLGNAFTYDLLPTISGSDSGVDEVAIKAPAGYMNLTVTSVSVGGAGQTSNCSTPGAGEYCTAIAGQVMTVTLGTKVGVSLTNIQVRFTADAPGSVGSADFTAAVDDMTTGTVPAQAAIAGKCRLGIFHITPKPIVDMRGAANVLRLRRLHPGVQQSLDVPLLVDRHQTIPNLVCGRVERHRQHAADFIRRAGNFRHHTRGRQGNAATR